MSDPISGFRPVVTPGARLLILGSMPSVASLEKQQYYGKPQNSFWRIMGALFDAGPELAYRERTQRLKDAGIAVWDVVAECVRPGSLDSAIDMQTVRVNDFETFFTQHDSISQVYFNGRKAEEIYRRRVLEGVHDRCPGIRYMTLPSTSPAMVALNFEAKLERWQVVRAALESNR